MLIGAIVLPLAVTLARRILPENAGIPLPGVVTSILTTADARLLSHATGTSGAAVLRNLIGPVYAGVAALLLARLGMGLFILLRAWRGAIPLPAFSGHDVPVRSSGRIRTPVSVGVGILLPVDWTRWSPEECQRVLAHETSHCRRGDFFWQLLARSYAAVFWANPLSWWLLRRLTVLAEHLSDDAVLAAHGSPADYAALLLEFSTQRRTVFLAVGMARRPELSQRIERILQPGSPDASRRAPRTALLTGLLTLTVSAAASPWFTVAPLHRLPALPALPALQVRLQSLPPLTADHAMFTPVLPADSL